MERKDYEMKFKNLIASFNNTPLIAEFIKLKGKSKNTFLTINFSLNPSKIERKNLHNYKIFENQNEVIKKINTKCISKYSQTFKNFLYVYKPEQFHFSLINIYSELASSGFKKIKEKTKESIPKIKEIIKERVNNYFQKREKSYFNCDIDFLFYSNESVALQVFLSEDFIYLLRDIQHELNKYFPNFENKLKLFPNENKPERSVINLFRYKRYKKEEKKKFFKFLKKIDEFNKERVKKYKNGPWCKIKINGLFLVYSDQYFSKEKRKIIYFFPFERS
jgi:hypothetical protein